MASTFAVTRNHLIFGLCLPLAILLGYLLADARDPASQLIILTIMGVLSVPIFMRWYHPLLVLSWLMAAQPAIPGSPHLWVVLSFVGLFYAVLGRSINPEHRFMSAPMITAAMLTLFGVIFLTAMLTGGVGLKIFGSASMGGRGYFYVFAAIAGYFALSSKSIPRHLVPLYVAMFFLPGLTAVIGRLAYWLGPAAEFVLYFFPPDFSLENPLFSQETEFGMTRLNGFVLAALAMFSWLLARYGITGVFDFTKPWRGALFGAAIAAGFFGGFRSYTIMMMLIFSILFYLERIWRTRLILVFGVVAVLLGALLIGFVDRLPFTVQRSLSFLPIGVSADVKLSAQVSSEWRVEMWRNVVGQIPKYLLRGKGYNVSPDDLYMAQYSAMRGFASSWEGAATAGDYHNGPLSVLIPFGIWGFAAFVWFIIAGSWYLYRNYRDGPEELKRINAFLFAFFVGRAAFFFLVFGALSTELYIFTGLLGMSVALNARKAGAPAVQPESAT
jgi:O-antigen ligase